MSKSKVAGRSVLAAAAALALTLIAVQPASANIVSGGARACPPDQTVRIGWSTSGVTGSRPYYNTTNGWVPGGWYTTTSATWNTGKRSITGWQVLADGTVTSAYSICG